MNTNDKINKMTETIEKDNRQIAHYDDELRNIKKSLNKIIDKLIDNARSYPKSELITDLRKLITDDVYQEGDK